MSMNSTRVIIENICADIEQKLQALTIDNDIPHFYDQLQELTGELECIGTISAVEIITKYPNLTFVLLLNHLNDRLTY